MLASVKGYIYTGKHLNILLDTACSLFSTFQSALCVRPSQLKMTVDRFHNTSSKSTMLHSEQTLADPTQVRNCVGCLWHLCTPESCRRA